MPDPDTLDCAICSRRAYRALVDHYVRNSVLIVRAHFSEECLEDTPPEAFRLLVEDAARQLEMTLMDHYRSVQREKETCG